jgi:hypothetical protein
VRRLHAPSCPDRGPADEPRRAPSRTDRGAAALGAQGHAHPRCCGRGRLRGRRWIQETRAPAGRRGGARVCPRRRAGVAARAQAAPSRSERSAPHGRSARRGRGRALPDRGGRAHGRRRSACAREAPALGPAALHARDEALAAPCGTPRSRDRGSLDRARPRTLPTRRAGRARAHRRASGAPGAGGADARGCLACDRGRKRAQGAPRRPSRSARAAAISRNADASRSSRQGSRRAPRCHRGRAPGPCGLRASRGAYSHRAAPSRGATRPRPPPASRDGASPRRRGRLRLAQVAEGGSP